MSRLEKKRAKDREYYARNKERIIAYQREYYQTHKIRVSQRNRAYGERHRSEILAYAKEYRTANRERVLEGTRKWKRTNPGRVQEHVRTRDARKINATPKWVNREEIAEIYERCATLNRTGVARFHVDHIYPLVSNALCGLHVPWNLRVITAEENMKKGNRSWPR